MIDRNTILRMSFEVAISLLLVFFIIAWSIRIVSPFIALLLWGAVIAISMHGVYSALRARLGSKLATALFGVVGVGIVVVPAYLFTESIFQSARAFADAVESGTFSIPPPTEQVQGWPIIGESLYGVWSEAASDFEQFLADFSPQLKEIATAGLSRAAGIGLTVLTFIASTLIATVLLANDKAVEQGMRRFFTRLVGPEAAGEHMGLTTATIRSVTMGVLGVAFIQAVAGGIGMIFAGVPGAGIWAIAILVLAIAQLPPLLVLLPAIIFVFSHESTMVASIFAVWSIAVSFSDALLKPLLLGRGVDVPTLVILLGAIGGMLMSGILGLFVGAVVLALGYKLMLAWLAMADEPLADDGSGETGVEAEASGR